MKSKFLIVAVMVSVCGGIGRAQAQNDPATDVSVRQVVEVKALVGALNDAMARGDKQQAGRLYRQLNQRWYGLPMGLREALEAQHPGTRGKMTGLLSRARGYLHGQVSDAEVRTLKHEGRTVISHKQRQRVDKITNEQGQLVREHHRRTRKVDANTTESQHTVYGSDGKQREVDGRTTRAGGTTVGEQTTRDGKGNVLADRKTTRIREGNTVTTKTVIHFQNQQWVELDSTSHRNGQTTTINRVFSNDQGNRLFCKIIETRNGQYTTREGDWRDANGNVLVVMKAQREKNGQKVTGRHQILTADGRLIRLGESERVKNGQSVSGKHELSNADGQMLHRHEYEHVKRGQVTSHQRVHTNGKGGQRTYQGTSTRHGSVIEHEGTITIRLAKKVQSTTESTGD